MPLLTTYNLQPSSAILEIRAGTGGHEAGLFAGELLRMYKRFAQSQGWTFTELSRREGGLGDLHELSAEISSSADGSAVNQPYSLLQHESGVHRVQRIPQTEKSGRIHTSTVTVAILPKVSPRQVVVNPHDLKMEFYRASSQGGQNVQKVSSAVRLTHLPTGLVVACQEERSQFQNRERALGLLRSKLFQMMQHQHKSQVNELRREQVGTGERFEKIRTYNFPQNRLTDHRLGQSFHNLGNILDGDLLSLLKSFNE